MERGYTENCIEEITYFSSSNFVLRPDLIHHNATLCWWDQITLFLRSKTIPYRTSSAFLKTQNNPKYLEFKIPEMKKNLRVRTRAVRNGLMSERDHIVPYKERSRLSHRCTSCILNIIYMKYTISDINITRWRKERREEEAGCRVKHTTRPCYEGSHHCTRYLRSHHISSPLLHTPVLSSS